LPSNEARLRRAPGWTFKGSKLLKKLKQLLRSKHQSARVVDGSIRQAVACACFCGTFAVNVRVGLAARRGTGN
jgi:hypothetical protein